MLFCFVQILIERLILCDRNLAFDYTDSLGVCAVSFLYELTEEERQRKIPRMNLQEFLPDIMEELGLGR